MIRVFPLLFLAGAAAGVFSVALFFFRCALSGAYSERIIPFPKKAKRGTGMKKQGRVLSFLLDFIYVFCTGLYLVLYDATLLGGKGRLFHLAFFFLGFFLVRFLFLSPLYRPTERVFRFLSDLAGAAFFCLCFPIRKTFSVILSILFGLYLILKRKNDKMKRKKQAKREIARLYEEMNTAFLPSAVTGAFAPGRD